MSQQLWFTSDTHLNHRRIPLYSKRRFCLTEQENRLLDEAYATGNLRGPDAWCPSDEALARHDDYLLDRINERVQPNDILYHLGDFCFGPNKHIYEVAQKFRDRINCKTVYLIWGNHDDHIIAPLFTNTYERTTVRWNGKRIIVDHYAAAVWNKSHRGTWQLYGHSHASAEHRMDAFMPGRRSMDVGVDNAKLILGEYRPFSFDEIEAILEQRTGCSIDHHVEE